MPTPLETLRQPLALKNERLPNRLAKAAMTEGLADAQGRPTIAHQKLYSAWARGGAGLLITGNVIIDRQHLERAGNVVIDREPDGDMRSGLEQWAKAARERGAGLWMQINHAGRQTQRTINPAPKAPSAVALGLPGKQFATPTPLSESEIETLVARFALAARTARETGFTGAQIHAAHGYLISQFLSPRANQRSDAWGGALENRARFLLEIVKRTREAVGNDFTLSVKLNSADFQRGGFASDESVTVAAWLEQAGVDVLEISGGTYEQPRMMKIDGMEKPDAREVAKSTRAREAYFIDFAVEMQKKVRIPLMVTGGFRSAAGMADAVARDGVAIIGMGRPLCVDPMGPGKILSGAETLDTVEDRLRLGPGWLGPKSPFPIIKAINGFGATFWFYQQIRRMGEGVAPDPNLAFMKAFQDEQAMQKAQLEESASWRLSARGD
jgi:2,4-dienoyl-CoA reductase-like NADH-dependent reductase (Old Yellow Enzyme family)